MNDPDRLAHAVADAGFCRVPNLAGHVTDSKSVEGSVGILGRHLLGDNLQTLHVLNICLHGNMSEIM